LELLELGAVVRRHRRHLSTTWLPPRSTMAVQARY
jgi:hypothetical protein